jgi:predicted phosphodiesterase
MIVSSATISYEYGQTYYLKPWFDIHLGSKACDLAAFKRDLKKTDENTYHLFGGDTFDALVVNDPRYRKSNDDTVGDAVIDENIDRMEEILKPYADRILGMAKGNHEDMVTKKSGTDMIARLCRRLGVKDLGYSGLYRLSFREAKKGKTTYRGRLVVIRYHHGWGGGSRTRGADLTKFSHDMQYWDADIFLYGHVHRKNTDKVDRIGLVGEKLVPKPKILCICGTYLKTYLKGPQPTYSEVKGYPPVSVGSCTVQIKPLREGIEIKAYSE